MEKSKEQFFKEMKTALIDLLPEGVSVRFVTVDRPGRPGLHSLTDSVYHYRKDTGFRKVADTLSGLVTQ